MFGETHRRRKRIKDGISSQGIEEAPPMTQLPDAPGAAPAADRHREVENRPPGIDQKKSRRGVIVRNVVIGVAAFLLGVTIGVTGGGNATELEAARSRAADLRQELE